MLNLAGYQEKNLIYNGTRTLVYRAVRATDTRPVIIKVLRNPHPNFHELVQFRNQYVITRHLEHPAIVKPIALERYDNGYALVMPDEGAIALWDYWQQEERNLTEFLDIAIQISVALHYLSGQRIIHKDIKPANIIIHQESRQIQIIDFSIASLLPKEQQQLINPNVLEGTLAYISPEQTGRMNRGIDYRTDFYSLGVTFFEMLAGTLPFVSSDPMELVHGHIAKMPPALGLTKNSEGQLAMGNEKGNERGNDKAIPEVINNIVFKLMAKNAEERYQSALGLKHDLERAEQQLETSGEIKSFALGERDRSDRFLIPEKLYGRSAEVKTLLTAFDRVANPPESPRNSGGAEGGRIEMMLVAGFSGIGKTAVINEVHKPILRQKGYFIKGKFDQFNRNIPLSALVQAFRDLMGQLLGESDTDLANWKAKILSALGDNAQVIIEVVPELELIIGKQPPVPELEGSAAQNRFNLLLRKFIAVFATLEHPLVLFVDDLQWVDSASLNLIKTLMGDGDLGYLLLLGAYRDNEVFPAHPLVLALSELEKEQALISTITLSPLSFHHINQLVAETLSCREELAEPLTDLVYQKTKGNPFFTTQFLVGLHQDELIAFNLELGYWQCDLVQVLDAALTDNVVEFMAGRLQKLPLATQKVLKLAACIGNQFDLETLATVCQESEEEVAVNTWSALQEGLILPISEAYKFFQGDPEETLANRVTASYRFLHDRVQQAAYSLIPDDQKETTHYRIGRLLLQEIPPEEQEERIFELVGQLNYGTALISEQKERDELADLNIVACRKARAATAYQAGREYASTGLSLLGEDAWTRTYEMSLAFHDLATELASLCGEFEEMERFFDTVVERANYALEQVNVYRIRIKSGTSRSRLAEAIALGKEILQKLGVSYPEKPTEEYIQQAIAQINPLIGDRDIEDLANLPRMTDPEKIAIVRIASNMLPPASATDPVFFPLLIALSVKVSIEYGNTEASLLGYSFYGFIACHVLQDVNAGVKFGQLAIQLVSQMDANAVKAEVLCLVALFSLHRKIHIKDTLPMLQEAYAAGLEVGNLEYAGYGADHFCRHSFWCGQPLTTLEEDSRAYYHRLVQLNQLVQACYCQTYWQTILNLLGMAEHPTILSGEVMEEGQFLTKVLSENNLSALYLFYLFKSILCYLFDDIESAREQTVETGRYLMGLPGLARDATFYLYDSLIALAAVNLPGEDRSELLKRVEQTQKQLQEQWARYAPMNHQHKVDLVEAEKCRVLGQKLEAIELYDKAISGAKANQYIQEEALANELAAKFYLDWGKETIAEAYMQKAYYCYARWGAKAKTDQLAEKYPQLLNVILNPSNPQTSSQGGTVTTTASDLDLGSAIKASQALSEEIELNALLSKVMATVVENAGADAGSLILNDEGSWEIVVQCDKGGCHLATIPLEQTSSLPSSIVNTVKRTGETILVNQLAKNTSFAADPYFSQQQPQSLCCTPILNQGKLIGILYLENHLVPEAFTPDHLEVLNIISAQAAISIDNARLYSRLERYSYDLEAQVQQRTQELQEKNQDLQETLLELQRTQAQLIQTEKMSSLGQMVAGIAHEINNPITFISGNIGHAREYVGELLDLLELYEKDYPEPTADIQDKLEELDLEFLCSDLEKLLSSMQNGSDRIGKIILGLRNFSRLDEADLKPVDIHEGLENTLTIVQHRLETSGDRQGIAIVKDYGTLPPVPCYANQLNQVFLNILTNALDVLTESQAGSRREIRIATEMRDAQTVRIRIADNGPGMSEGVRQKVFDPFFTTKPVGQGTGLGLSISYQIVTEQHGGQLHCTSEPGLGTEFIIEIPRRAIGHSH